MDCPYEFKKIDDIWHRRLLEPGAVWERLEVEIVSVPYIRARRRNGNHLYGYRHVRKWTWVTEEL